MVSGENQPQQLIEGGKDKPADFKDEEIKEIGSLNPLEDFKKMVSD